MLTRYLHTCVRVSKHVHVHSIQKINSLTLTIYIYTHAGSHIYKCISLYNHSIEIYVSNTFAFTHMHARTYSQTHASTCMHTHILKRSQIHSPTHSPMHTHTHKCMCVSMYMLRVYVVYIIKSIILTLPSACD